MPLNSRLRNSVKITLFILATMPGLLSKIALAENKIWPTINSANEHSFSPAHIPQPAEYYQNRVKALHLVKQKQWLAAKPIIESLTRQYPHDGDTWYILGITCFQLKEWQKSIAAFKQTLALGTILSGIPSGSAPSNDIMLKVAEAYSELGQNKDALVWINKALDARHDGRKNIAASPHFANMAESRDFLKASGTFLPEGLSRDESWRFDLQFLVSEIERLHVHRYHATSEQAFRQQVTSIHEKIPSLTDQQIVFEFMQLVAMLGNGHNFIIPTYNKLGSFTQLPMQFYQFSDGLFIVAAEQNYQHLIGSKVTAIGKTDIFKALDKIKAVNARDNEMQQLWLAPHYLGLPEVLAGLGIIKDAKQVSLTIENSEGQQQTITPVPKTMTFNGFPKLPAPGEITALHNLRISEQYWYQDIEDRDAMYVQYNYVHNNPAISFEQFNKNLREELQRHNTQNLIIDIRHNAGGDGSTYPPLLKTLVQFEASQSNGRIFVIIGRNTFSAAHNLLLDINRLTNAILVGEPSGSRPNALSEAGWVKLPYSGTLGIISSQFHQPSKAEDHRIWVAPHVPVSLSSGDYFSGVDPALQAIFKISDKKTRQ